MTEGERKGTMDSRTSPEHVQTSLAAALTLGFQNGSFHRNARLKGLNLLLRYEEGCSGRCHFCGLSRSRTTSPGAKTFIRVAWPVYSLDEIIARVKGIDQIHRVCLSMITHPRCRDDVLRICRRVTKETGKAVSLLISPSLIHRDDLQAMKDAGADRIGVAVDGATREIFERLRGKPVHGPHQWDRYWRIYEESIRVFGEGMAGVHLICGLGETEREMTEALSRVRIMGGYTHLFSFFPERGSVMEFHSSPPIGSYRRIQLTRWLIDNDRTRFELMEFYPEGRVRGFGLSESDLSQIIRSGAPFETSGCPGPDGRVACNRPYGNEKPGEAIRNFPFPPEEEDLKRILEELNQY